VVLKLAAILRVADALDRGHKQRVRDFEIERREDELVLHCETQGDTSVERFGIALKADMFEEVFGMKVVLL
jgi:exopolyphosphatase/guanosine-5'-triphosphate,3'-diphosphate pyrophosphatase